MLVCWHSLSLCLLVNVCLLDVTSTMESEAEGVGIVQEGQCSSVLSLLMSVARVNNVPRLMPSVLCTSSHLTH